MQSGEARKPWLTAWRSGDRGAECPTCGKGRAWGEVTQRPFPSLQCSRFLETELCEMTSDSSHLSPIRALK